MYGHDASLTNAQRDYFLAALDRHEEALTGVTLVPAACVYIVVAILAYILAPPAPRPIMLMTFMLMFLEAALFILAQSPRFVFLRKRLKRNGALTPHIGIIGSALALHALLSSEPSLLHAVIGGAIYCTLSAMMFVSSSNYQGRVLLEAFEFFVGGWYVLPRGTTTLECVAWFCTLSVVIIYGVVTHVKGYRNLQKQALRDLEQRELIKQNEQLRLRVIEQELTVARQVQDSLEPAITDLNVAHAELRFYQQRHGYLGGDWAGARSLSTGELVLAVADVTGKGIPAAMVAQAIHTLWAAQLKFSHFDPEHWLSLVNSTLLTMGHSEPHTATLGLVIIGADKLSYYSCGHIPLIIAYEKDEDLRFDRLVASGNILGISEDLNLSPISLSLDKQKYASILLGTDGVFESVSRLRQSKLKAFLSDLEAYGAQALEQGEVKDDQLLMWVKRRRNIDYEVEQATA